MKGQALDKLNVGLLLLSLGVAWFLPFDGFLIAYAVLGPLHYLTEMWWLKRRDFFIPRPWAWPLFFVLLALLLSYYPLADLLGYSKRATGLLAPVVNHPQIWLLTLLFGAVGLVVVRSTWARLIWFGGGFVCAFLLDLCLPTVAIGLKLMVPTLIHVYLFTLLFMVFGQRKSGSRAGWVVIGLMLLAPVLIVFVPMQVLGPQHAGAGRFFASDLQQITTSLAHWLGGGFSENEQMAREFLQRVQVFVAFAYIYHYLNWFSKTTIIGWQKAMNKRDVWTIGAIWVASMAVYAWDFEKGLGALFFLSLLHVVLEFPLNALTFKALFSRPSD